MVANKRRKFKIIIVIIVLIIFAVLVAISLIIYGNIRKDKENQITSMNEYIKNTAYTIDSLQVAIRAYNNFTESTGNQRAYSYTPGLDALSFLSSATSSYASDWEKCNSSFNDELDSAIGSEQEAIGRVSGEDKDLLQDWVREAEIISNWAMCYGGNLIINELEAKNNTDDFKGISLQVEGRMSLLQDLLSNKKKSLKKFESSNFLFL